MVPAQKPQKKQAKQKPQVKPATEDSQTGKQKPQTRPAKAPEGSLTGKAIAVKKGADFSDWFTEIVNKAELADIRYGVKGFVCYMPWAVMSIKKMYAKYETLLEKNGHIPLIMPTVIPKSFFEKEADHIKGFAPEVFWVTE